MTLAQIAETLHIATDNIPDANIQWLLTDSRSLAFPHETLFFALQTARNDGHNYIPELYRRQVRYFIVSHVPPDADTLPDALFLRVENPLQALQTLAATHRAAFHIPIIGITGSNGKTVVKEWLYQLLHAGFRTVRSPRSYNSQIGVPLSVWALDARTELGIFEAGISQTGEMEHLEPIIRPTIGIFTNIGAAHQAGFADGQQKADEKIKLFKNTDTLIYNADNEPIEQAISRAQLKARRLAWGTKPTAQLQVLRTRKNGTTAMELMYQHRPFRVEIPFTDDASIENALQCVCVMLLLGYTTDEIGKRLAALEPVAMRLEVKEGVNGCLLINDTYNSDLNSLSIALDFLNRQSVAKNLPRTLILSDILQSGHPADELYRTVAQLINQQNIQKLIGVGSALVQAAPLFQTEEKHFFHSTDELLQSPQATDFNNELVLLKGARSFHFENLLARLEQQVHETTLDIDLNAFVHNFNYFRSHLRPETKTIGMVKAFAYGSGSVEIARTLQNNRCDYLAVAVADEGVELRREGIRLPIMVMNPEKGAFDTLIEHRLEPEIYSFRLLENFISAAERWAITDYPIHLKIDSGMHRLGFNPDDVPALIQRLMAQNQVKIRSVFSHLAGADNPLLDEFTHAQAAVFNRCADEITRSFSHRIMRHLLNSAGVERFPQYRMDMVRLGIGLYSVSALKNVRLETVCTLKTIILQIRAVKAGETIGYNRNDKLLRDSRVGVIPVGYADGFDRRLGNGVGSVWVNGQRARVVGNVCMDLCMIDLTDIAAHEGDAVEIFGKNIPMEEIAEKLNTIPYEILTGVSKRVKRVYFVD